MAFQRADWRLCYLAGCGKAQVRTPIWPLNQRLLRLNDAVVVHGRGAKRRRAIAPLLFQQPVGGCPKIMRRSGQPVVVPAQVTGFLSIALA
jgi:hypothetical protein